ncbi:hypothetical protein NKR23_g3524 [Pleurostoma richardsiae]|uniref:Myb-like domain-containing protein n=1 Tax=Pleurostoma richardsiae TaxID=41990 RepID=A0AA38RKZ4_9PEZI|nr:hypothetical protein NKR23_g3524 [Pleurostoma richardsiae]
MSPTMHMPAPPAVPYTPTTDIMDRHEYGISKNRKVTSTGGGRAWSEDEEVYLLQTRLQKMPYKHIAAHLKKTELACRLHYHQLSHGSNRRKRTTSMSSGSSSGGHSPILPAVPSPIHESSSRSVSPPGSAGSYGPPSPVQLPSIIAASSGASPRLPAILPKPASMTLALANASSNTSSGYPTPIPEVHPQQHSAPLLPSTSFAKAAAHTPTAATAPHSATMAPLRLDCSALPPPPQSAGIAQPVDMSRLHAIYNAHRNSFWSAIASDYGTGVNPAILEQAWKNGMSGYYGQTATPITPVGSPDDRDAYGPKPDKTRISAILGIDANPRSPREREMVRRLEEERVMVGVGA